MLLHITNRCLMGCPHCLQDANPLGGMMDNKTFENALKFAVDNGVLLLVIGGGEPTEHPRLLEFCREIDKTHIRFSIVSNGMWLGDSKTERMIEEISGLRNHTASQIYSNPRWYRLHNETVAKYEKDKDRWLGLRWNLITDEIKAMLDIGRAKTCPDAIEETKKHRFHNSCLCSCVTAAQTREIEDFFHLMFMQGRFCTPMVSYDGFVHMSESILCPTCEDANVNTHSSADIWRKMRRFRPCCKCIPGQRYLTETTPKIVAARRILGQ